MTSRLSHEASSAYWPMAQLRTPQRSHFRGWLTSLVLGRLWVQMWYNPSGDILKMNSNSVPYPDECTLKFQFKLSESLYECVGIWLHWSYTQCSRGFACVCVRVRVGPVAFATRQTRGWSSTEFHAGDRVKMVPGRLNSDLGRPISLSPPTHRQLYNWGCSFFACFRTVRVDFVCWLIQRSCSSPEVSTPCPCCIFILPAATCRRWGFCYCLSLIDDDKRAAYPVPTWCPEIHNQNRPIWPIVMVIGSS